MYLYIYIYIYILMNQFGIHIDFAMLAKIEIASHKLLDMLRCSEAFSSKKRHLCISRF